MPSFMLSAALAALVSVAAGAPTESIEARSLPAGAFQIKQVDNGQQYINGQLEMMKTYNKFADAGAVAPESVRSGAQKAAKQQGSVKATPEQFDQAYVSPVTLGSSLVMLDFDTGSADLWAFSNEQPAAQRKGHAFYNTASGNELQGYSWSIVYGDGSGASGNVFADKVVVGGVTATRQAVEAATSVSQTFRQNKPRDGILGLAFSKINEVSPKKQTTFFDTVKNTLTTQVFTADLKKGQPGSYTFGYIDNSLYTGSISYVPVNTAQGFWQFTAGGYAVGSGSTSGSLGTSIADTGTSLLYIPNAAAVDYYSQVPGAQYDSADGIYVLPCNSNPPDFKVKIGSGTFTVPGSYMVYAPLTAGSKTCAGGIQANTGIGFNIFGDIFLKAVYAIFDESQGSPRLGFAAQS